MGGDKPRRYFLARALWVGAGFIPARKGIYAERPERRTSNKDQDRFLENKENIYLAN